MGNCRAKVLTHFFPLIFVCSTAYYVVQPESHNLACSYLSQCSYRQKKEVFQALHAISPLHQSYLRIDCLSWPSTTQDYPHLNAVYQVFKPCLYQISHFCSMCYLSWSQISFLTNATLPCLSNCLSSTPWPSSSIPPTKPRLSH